MPSVLQPTILDCKLDMEQHCKWTFYGSDGLGGKGCTRKRPEVAPARSWARFSESLVSGHSSSFGRLCCATPIYSSVARFKPVDVYLGDSPSFLVSLIVVSDFGRVSTRPDLRLPDIRPEGDAAAPGPLGRARPDVKIADGVIGIYGRGWRDGDVRADNCHGQGSSFNDGAANTQTARDLPFGQSARTDHSFHPARLKGSPSYSVAMGS